MFALEMRGSLPHDLDDWQPGPELGAFLADVDLERLSGHDRVVVLRAIDRMAAHFAALRYEAMAAVTDAMDETDERGRLESAESEIAAALHLTRRAAESELSTAWELHQRHPRVLTALRYGRIDVRRARVMIDTTGHLTDAAARDVVARVIDDVETLTTGQLRHRIRRMCIETDPDDAKARYDRSVEERRVVMYPTTQGTAELFAADLPPHEAAAAMRRVNRLARSLRTAGETRTMDQLRADVFLDLLKGTGVAKRSGRGTVELRAPLPTLVGLSNAPGELAGYGPVIADVARQVAEQQRDAEWRFVVTDPDNGEIVHVGTTQYRPTAQQRRTVEAIYSTCVFPGCRMPAGDNDLDHRNPHAEGGPTAVPNLAPLCRHHHTTRHRFGWSYERLPNGDHRWRSPLGHHYVVGRDPP
ncbi:MAG: DUF222 domain-containing protein [Acidimicrobiia bacterium]|nr:DUF222 domain-containing protein [Acidimicrobiia bacterium]